MDMDMKRGEWLYQATKEIRFKPDREAVRQELQEHMDDKIDDLRRIFPDMPFEEAQERVIREMGDASEIGRELARIYKPWLGYLWIFSKVMLGLLVGVFVVYCVTTNDYYSSAAHPLWSEWSSDFGAGAGDASEPVELGGHTFRILEAVYLDYPEEKRQRDDIRIALRVSTPRFWERVDPNAVVNSLTAVTEDGTRYPMDQQTVLMDEEKKIEYVLCSAYEYRRGLFYRDFAVYLDAPWQEGDRATLEFAFALGDVVLRTGEIVRVVME